MRRAVDTVVVGGGVIGCAVSRSLAMRGQSVELVERDAPGRQASWAAGGMLSPLGEAGASDAYLELGDASLTRFAAYAASLHEETSIDIQYRTGGRLQVTTGSDDELRRYADSPLASRFGIRLLDGDAARTLEQALSPAVTAALAVDRDHRVDNRLLAEALHLGAAGAGVVFRNGDPVSEVLHSDDAVRGVRLASGAEIAAGHVVLAAGAWSGGIEGLPRPLQVRPMKGQMFAVDARAAGHGRDFLRHVVGTEECYIIPRDDGRLLVGATVEDVGFRAGPTPRGIAGLIAAAIETLPILADLPLIETWAGFRPVTPDGLPIIGLDPSIRGLVYATGHFRNGILLAPITADCVAALLFAEPPPVPLEAFAVDRFGDNVGPTR